MSSGAMRIARSAEEAAGFEPSALTIGKFDGVHAAHGRLLSEVVSIAREHGLRPSALTFDRHPACVLAPGRAPRPLTTLEERLARMRELGIEQVLIIPFTLEVARMSPQQFVAKFVRGSMDARVVLVGENFRFGNNRAGDPRVLAEIGRSQGFETRVAAPVKVRGVLVSTSEIRALLEAGDVSRACRLLVRPYAISGEVVSGHGVGSRQTVPTLNLNPPAKVLPCDGVYITRTYDVDRARHWNSITNIGFRPTFGGAARGIETYLLDPLEGSSPARIRVEFLRRVREERKFETPEALKRQILSDVTRAQVYFRRLNRFHG
jgi:riboflavin kinase/FMN adenylyltransferase